LRCRRGFFVARRWRSGNPPVKTPTADAREPPGLTGGFPASEELRRLARRLGVTCGPILCWADEPLLGHAFRHESAACPRNSLPPPVSPSTGEHWRLGAYRSTDSMAAISLQAVPPKPWGIIATVLWALLALLISGIRPWR
jgi:hypothetical protein